MLKLRLGRYNVKVNENKKNYRFGEQKTFEKKNVLVKN